MSAIIFQIQSTLILLLLWVGVINKKNRGLHVKLMSIGIIWDILLVLQIELTRGAIAKASKVVTNEWLLNFHVTIAVSTVVLYGFMVYFGRKLLKGDNSVRAKHKLLGIITITLRTLTYITSFLVAGK